MYKNTILLSIFKKIVAGLAFFGLSMALANGVLIPDGYWCDPTFCDPVKEYQDASE